MGVLNVTPDSFSDGGCYADRDAAVAHGLQMHAAGADYVDVGGESTRPGADRVDAEEECRRALLAGLGRLVAVGLPVLVGASRRTFLGRLLAGPDGAVRPVEGREAATVAISVLAAQAGAWGVRVHDPVQSLDAIATLDAVRA